jgi:3D (Asp-Asp-Asp) domain-containing protein
VLTLLATITAYCVGICCCGPQAHGLTKSGRHAEVGITAACGPDLRGRIIEIEGVGVRFCEDAGSKIGRGKVDVLMASHVEAKRFGRRARKVTVIR